MTLKELYAAIGGDYDQAIRVLLIEKLIDKHIRKFPSIAVFPDLAQAGHTMDAARLFEAAHAIKGVCANLGLVRLAAVAAEVCDEFRPGRPRKLTDEEVRQKLGEIDALYRTASDGIRAYEQAGQ